MSMILFSGFTMKIFIAPILRHWEECDKFPPIATKRAHCMSYSFKNLIRLNQETSIFVIYLVNIQ